MTAVRVSPRKQPRQKRAKVTVEAILDATAHVLIKEGYDRASTNKIAAKAGVSIGSLYQYFPSKEALVAALVDRHIQDTAAICATALAEAETMPLADAVRNVVEAILATNAHDPRLRVVILEQVPRVGRLQKLGELHAATTEMLAGVLDRRRAELRVRDTNLAAFMVVEAVDALINASLDPKKPLPGGGEIVAEIADFVLAYLRGTGPVGTF